MTGDDDGPQPGYTWLDGGMGRLTMGLCLEQSSPLAKGPNLGRNLPKSSIKVRLSTYAQFSKIQFV
jgi:hypothetical protein